REKHYLVTLAIGVVLNVGLSLLFAFLLFPTRPAFGVALATGITDVLILVYLIAISWQWSKKAIFNLNNLKIVLFGLGIGVLSFFVAPLLIEALPWKGNDLYLSYLLGLLIMVAIDAVIYVFGLALVKERLVGSLFRRKGNEHA
ncbi:MAG: polysaccharide biosynthesis C-terminal domain-containing protein, partial [Bacilli bacterium]|nr:polysaccharide biosynthesis C-terminal domain-containing protein [Bacilli bacterium]